MTRDLFARLDWPRIEADLDAAGCAATGPLLDPDECAALRALYDEEARFRSRIVMGRHGFGSGEYKYYAHPLPEPVARLRAAFYERLVPLANRWNEAMGLAPRYPAGHDAFLRRCHEAGQTRPTPLLPDNLVEGHHVIIPKLTLDGHALKFSRKGTLVLGCGQY